MELNLVGTHLAATCADMANKCEHFFPHVILHCADTLLSMWQPGCSLQWHNAKPDA